MHRERGSVLSGWIGQLSEPDFICHHEDGGRKECVCVGQLQRWRHVGLLASGNLERDVASRRLAPVSVSPGTGAGPAGTPQFFTFTYSDPLGAGDISGSQIILNPALQGAFACYVLYGRGTNLVAIANDTATVFHQWHFGDGGYDAEQPVQHRPVEVVPGADGEYGQPDAGGELRHDL